MTKDFDTYGEKAKAIHFLWVEWLVSYGAATLSVMLSAVFSRAWVGLIVLLIARLLRAFANVCRAQNAGRDPRIATATSSALYVSGLLMIAISLLMRSGAVAKIFDPGSINPEIPFVSALIVYPAIFAFVAYGRLTSQRIYEIPATPDSFIAIYRAQETKYLQGVMLWLCGGMSIVGWAYYFEFYINVNFNSPDTFFYHLVPLTLYILSLVYIGARYKVEAYIARKLKAANNGRSGLAPKAIDRHLVIRGDLILLAKNKDGLYDTPYENTAAANSRPAPGAEDSGTDGTRLLYTQYDPDTDTIYRHYLRQTPADTSPGDTQDLEQEPGQWNTLEDIDKKAKEHILAPRFSAEIFRVYTIAMAWKTYDKHGRRLYPVRNYHPTFCLRDILGWDVDFQDNRWIDIATHNQDKALWRIKDILRRAYGAKQP